MVGSSILKFDSKMWGRGSTAPWWVGGAGSSFGNGWTKTGGEMLRRVNGKSGSLLAVCGVQSVRTLVFYKK